MIKYCIFDMDGTLLDTERHYRDSWIEASIEQGYEDPVQVYPFIVGRSLEMSREVFEEKYGKDADFDKFITRRMELYSKKAAKELNLMPGCRELLEYCREHSISTALATSTYRDIATRNLERTGILGYIDVIVTAQDVKNGKPAPDIFIEAGKRLGGDPKETAVVEDAYNGIRGAYAAKMIPIMAVNLQEPTEEMYKLSKAVCKDLFEVRDFIDKENIYSK